MANKAAKSLARRNTTTLNRTHLITLCVHALYLISHFFLFPRRQPSLTLYLVLSAPGLAIEFWLERIARPTYDSAAAGGAGGAGAGGELRRSGEDLEAKGLTEWMWDVLYWTWGCLVVVALVGKWGWWLWALVPLYSAWLAYTTFGNMRQGLAGMGGASEGTTPDGQGGSNRQKKMEKRGGQKMQYR